MILVVTGTEKFSFHRLVAQMDALAADLADGDCFMQIGASSHEPVSCAWERTIPFSDMVERIDAADVVVSHAGAGSTLLCVQRGKRPILVPRRRRFAEHVDDHQVLFAEKMAEAGLARAVLDPADLRSAIEQELDQPTEQAAGQTRPEGDRRLVEYLGNLLAQWQARGSPEPGMPGPG